MKKIAIGTDIGGSHISCVAIDFEKQLIIEETLVTKAVDNQAPAEHILDNWVKTLSKSIAKIDRTQLVGIGFAMPGPFDYAAGIALFTKDVAKYHNLYGVNVSERIRDELALPADFELRYMNDATAFGVGEAWLGKASGVKRSIAITLGTGLGSAFLENGIPVVGGGLVPPMGAMWHLGFLDDIADACFSTRWLIKRYAEKSGTQLIKAKQIADRAATDSPAKDVFIEFGTNLGAFIGPWAKRFGAEVVVIGGNVSAAYNYFGPSLEAAFRRQNLPSGICVSELKEGAALLGSARLFEENFWEKLKPLLSKMRRP